MPVRLVPQSRRFRIWSEMSSSSSRLHLHSLHTRGHRDKTGGRGKWSHALNTTTTRSVRGAMIAAMRMSSQAPEIWPGEDRDRALCQHLRDLRDTQETSKDPQAGEGEGRGSHHRCTTPSIPTTRCGQGQWRPAHREVSATGLRETPMDRGAGQLLSSLSPRLSHRFSSLSHRSSHRVSNLSSPHNLSSSCSRDRGHTAKPPPR